MGKTQDLANKHRYLRNKEDAFDPYEQYDLFSATVYEVRKAASERKWLLFQKNRPKAAAFLTALFSDTAAEVSLYFPPDISELRCVQLLAAIKPGEEIESNRALDSIDSHIEDL